MLDNRRGCGDKTSHKNSKCICLNKYETDYFARQILMPTDSIKKYIFEFNKYNKDSNYNNGFIKKLATEYRVPYYAVKQRLQDEDINI